MIDWNVIKGFDFDILNTIQSNLRCEALDDFFTVLTKIAGNYGHLWLALALVLLIFRKTRRCSFAILLSYALVFVLGQFVLKDLIARVRPCNDGDAVQAFVESLKMITTLPTSYSCPSTHSAWAFAAATSVFMFRKRWGLVVLIPALAIAFSRLYLYVHFPTDVLFGAVLGILMGIAASVTVKAIAKKVSRKKA